MGEGAFAKVYHALKKDTQEEFAIKVLNKKNLQACGKQKEAYNERNALLKLAHPSIVRLFWCFHDKENLYFVLELVDNGELSNLMRRVGVLDLRTTSHYSAELLLSLAYMHKQGFVHRDLKPRNILFDKFMRLRLIDFGAVTTWSPESAK